MVESRIWEKIKTLHFLETNNLVGIAKYAQEHTVTCAGRVFADFYRNEGENFEDAEHDLETLCRIGFLDKFSVPMGRGVGEEPDIVDYYLFDHSLDWYLLDDKPYRKLAAS